MAFLHVVFFVLESVLWTTPKVRHVFGTQEDAEATRVLALNQGFYNLGAAMLLIWFYAIGSESGVLGVLVFLAVMGIVGALTANWRIIIVQSSTGLCGLDDTLSTRGINESEHRLSHGQIFS